MDRAPKTKVIPDRLFFRIGDVADILDVKPYVLRYWEQEFPIIQPGKAASGHRVYKRIDVELLSLIHHLLYSEKFSIEGARRRIKELKKEKKLPDAIQSALDSMSDTALESPRKAARAETNASSDAVGATTGVSPRVHASVSTSTDLTALKKAAQDLLELSRQPIQELFG
ncbi:MAG: MerR family transcriptional regulator [Bdellovibrionales bacterium]|nr:MerR family transcriptional regulator [Bdellovibrionales bacterium]